MQTMDDQTSFDDLILVGSDASIAARFAEFHAQFPEVYEQLVRLARRAKRAGAKKVGCKALFEIVRWRTMLGDPDGTFKLNNNYTSHYSRLIMEQEPDLADLFATRELRA